MASVNLIDGGEWVKFNFYFLILIIILYKITCGMNLILQKPFFSNFGAIVTFAIFGTFVASMVTGILV